MLGGLRRRLTTVAGRASSIADRRPDGNATAAPQRLLFAYHKCGTVLLSKVFGDICDDFGLRFEWLGGMQYAQPQDVDVALLGHSLYDRAAFDAPYRGVHLVRDPRDVVASGYRYHLETDEPWCTNADVTIGSTIEFPQVPYSQLHRPHAWKVAYLESLDGRSYQENLRARSEEDGMRFEMEHYGRWTIEAMTGWEPTENILELRFEDVLGNFDDSFRSILTHLEFTPDQIDRGMALAQRHDLQRMSAKQVQRIDHVTSRQSRSWEAHFTPALLERFDAQFGSAVDSLGYADLAT